jgi:4-diphosphocytidyl-2-C-methyl-D-erythritol kinase
LSEAAAAGGLELIARAKLNLYLHLLGRRADGYHEVESLVAFTAFGDRLSFARSPGLRLEVQGPFAKGLEPAADNLVLKAARLLQSRFGVTEGAEIRLEKRLPVAAGLGGGSADAAATLIGLSRLWGLEAPAEALHRLALELGADLPACLLGRPAFVGGIGERLEPVNALPELGVVLVNPRIPLATAAVFAARSGAFSSSMPRPGPIAGPQALVELLQARRNDLTRPAVALVPEIGVVLTALAELPGVRLARMSGSGASCFGLTLTQGEAERAAATLRAARPGWWVEASRIGGSGGAFADGRQIRLA